MVLEYRKDWTKNDVVIIANERSKRPVVFGRTITCPFCRGSEHVTPPTKFALPSEENWNIRVFDNAFSLVGTEKEYTDLDSSDSSYAYGEHELIVETDVHEKLYQELSDDELKHVFSAYRNRLEKLSGNPKAEYVLLFKNHGRMAGASIEHEHSQIISFPFLPEIPAEELAAVGDYKDKFGSCLYCDMPEKEKDNVLMQGEHFVAICPSFSRFQFEMWILPKKHVKSMLELDEDGMTLELAVMVRECLRRLFFVAKDYNIIYHNAPKGKDVHFHVEIYPRSGSWAGVELGTGVIANTKSEKDSLEALRRFEK
ncbi:MAG: DUF4931 domain-containing protein [Candidatus Micrarchaeota archaeon]